MSEASVEQFLSECGWSGPLRLGLEDPDGSPVGPGREFVQPYVVIGRRATADVTLVHPHVSRNHTYLQVISGRVFGIDLLSRTGTHWEGERQPWGWIEPGSAVQIAGYRLRPWGTQFETRTGAVETKAFPISRSFEVPGAEDAVLELLNPQNRSSSAWCVNRAILLLGRSPACKVHLPSPRCASIHASLVQTGKGLWIVDMCSLSGTHHNGRSVRSAKLVDGDEIAVGPFRLRIHIGPSASRILASNSLPATRRKPLLNGDLPAPPGQGGVSPDPTSASGVVHDPLAIELLREISRQQSESTEQFQQMIGIFYQMHQEQMGLVAGELDRLKRLVEGRTMVRDTHDNVSHPPEDSRGSPSSRLPLSAPVAGREPGAGDATEARPFPPPANDAVPSGTTNAADSSGEFHLILAQRLAAYKEDPGPLKKMIEWLSSRRSPHVGR